LTPKTATRSTCWPASSLSSRCVRLSLRCCPWQPPERACRISRVHLHGSPVNEAADVGVGISRGSRTRVLTSVPLYQHVRRCACVFDWLCVLFVSVCMHWYACVYSDLLLSVPGPEDHLEPPESTLTPSHACSAPAPAAAVLHAGVSARRIRAVRRGGPQSALLALLRAVPGRREAARVGVQLLRGLCGPNVAAYGEQSRAWTAQSRELTSSRVLLLLLLLLLMMIRMMTIMGDLGGEDE